MIKAKQTQMLMKQQNNRIANEFYNMHFGLVKLEN